MFSSMCTAVMKQLPIQHEVQAVIDLFSDVQSAATPHFRVFEPPLDGPKRSKRRARLLAKSKKSSPSTSAKSLKSSEVSNKNPPKSTRGSGEPKQTWARSGVVPLTELVGQLSTGVKVAGKVTVCDCMVHWQSVNAAAQHVLNSGRSVFQNLVNHELKSIGEFGNDLYKAVTPTPYQKRKKQTAAKSEMHKVRRREFQRARALRKARSSPKPVAFEEPDMTDIKPEVSFEETTTEAEIKPEVGIKPEVQRKSYVEMEKEMVIKPAVCVPKVFNGNEPAAKTPASSLGDARALALSCCASSKKSGTLRRSPRARSVDVFGPDARLFQ